MMLYSLEVLFILVVICLTGSVTSDFIQTTPNIIPERFTVQGNGSVSSTGILVTQGAPSSASLIYFNTKQNVLEGFVTTLYISVSECDNIPWSQGADGFAFFIASEINATEDIDYGGSLGLSYKTNIAFIGFDLFLQQLKFNVTGVGVTVQSVLPSYTRSITDLSAWRCGGYPITVTIDYTPPSTFRIIGSRPTVVTPVVTDLTVELDITPYFPPGAELYVGVSGATGQGFMRQEFISWEFSSKTDVVPYLDCYEYIGSQYKAHMSYDNVGSIPAFIEVGPRNSFSPAPIDRGQIKDFDLGRSRFYPANPFSVIWDGTELTWNLTSHFVTFDANIPSLICPTNVTLFVQFKAPRNLTQSELDAIIESIAIFMGISPSRIDLRNFGLTLITKRSTTQTDPLAELEIEIAAPGSNTPDEPTAADAVRDFIDKAANRTIGTQVIDPDGDLGLEFLDSFPKETNNNGTGRLITQAPVGQPLPTPVAVPAPISTPQQQVPVFVSPASSVLAEQIVRCFGIVGALLAFAM